MPLQIIIVGAGIGGLTAALALRQAGHKVTILEKDIRKTEAGFGIVLTPNASRVLQRLGVDFEKMKAVRLDGLVNVRADRWPLEVIDENPFVDAVERYGAPSLGLHRVDLQRCLLEMAVGEGKGEPVKIVEGVVAKAFDATRGRVILESGEAQSADFIVAADGSGSRAHAEIIGEERPAKWTGLNNIRFTLPTSVLMDNEMLRRMLETYPSWGTMYCGAEAGANILRYPCRSNTLHNFGMYQCNPDPQASEQRWKTQTKLEIALSQLGSMDETFMELARQANPDSMYNWKVLERDPIGSFHKERLIVLGDAAHPMLPTLGNGAAQAIEDAGVLGVAMEGVHDLHGVSERLVVWNTLRVPRTSAVQMLCRVVSPHVTPNYGEAERKRVREFISEAEVPGFEMKDINAWLYGYDCLEEAQKAVSKLGGRKDSVKDDTTAS